METNQNFYQRQNEWSQIYFRPRDEQEQKKLELLQDIAGIARKTGLELGAGGGQFAIAAAESGFVVTAVEQEAAFVEHARLAAKTSGVDGVSFLCADFYDLEFTQPFDLIWYWDGFGLGSDAGQRRLLKKMASWLKPNGLVLLDVFTPWYWSGPARGRSWKVEQAMRLYDFDAQNNRLLDHWWQVDHPETKITQSIRCYSPADMLLLLEGSGLELFEVHPGGAVNYDSGEYIEKAPLLDAMSYIAVLRHALVVD
ncbi:MAG: class I SAM-dependent methyltransferase [Chloroflexi bacterium HGW-Chloroflexi-10]|nr:MAG: class I SAM-dependent methyltransferase [Chloroflexi bacterium HGW-Chloroflexi-10]